MWLVVYLLLIERLHTAPPAFYFPFSWGCTSVCLCNGICGVSQILYNVCGSVKERHHAEETSRFSVQWLLIFRPCVKYFLERQFWAGFSRFHLKWGEKKCLEVFPCRSRTLYTNTACQLSDQNSEKGRTVGSNRWHLLWKCHQAPNYSSTAGCLCNRFSHCCHDVMAIILEAWDCLTPGACGNCLCYSDKGDQRISVSLSVNGYRSQHRKKHRFCFWMLELRCRDTWMVKRLC